jgi:hypothetical protein
MAARTGLPALQVTLSQKLPLGCMGRLCCIMCCSGLHCFEHRRIALLASGGSANLMCRDAVVGTALALLCYGLNGQQHDDDGIIRASPEVRLCVWRERV